jgi:hypothetical protein
LIAKRQDPVLLIETKTKDFKVRVFGINLAKKLGDIPIVQLIHRPKIFRKLGEKVFVISAHHFFSGLP